MIKNNNVLPLSSGVGLSWPHPSLLSVPLVCARTIHCRGVDCRAGLASTAFPRLTFFHLAYSRVRTLVFVLAHDLSIRVVVVVPFTSLPHACSLLLLCKYEKPPERRTSSTLLASTWAVGLSSGVVQLLLDSCSVATMFWSLSRNSFQEWSDDLFLTRHLLDMCIIKKRLLHAQNGTQIFVESRHTAEDSRCQPALWIQNRNHGMSNGS